MSEARLDSQRNLSKYQEEVQRDMDKSVSPSESCTDDMHMTEIHISDSSSAKNLSHEHTGEEEEGHQDAIMQNCGSNERVHTDPEENSDPSSTNPETSQNFKVMLLASWVSALFCSKLL